MIFAGRIQPRTEEFRCPDATQGCRAKSKQCIGVEVSLDANSVRGSQKAFRKVRSTWRTRMMCQSDFQGLSGREPLFERRTTHSVSCGRDARATMQEPGLWLEASDDGRIGGSQRANRECRGFSGFGPNNRSGAVFRQVLPMPSSGRQKGDGRDSDRGAGLRTRR